LEIHTIHNLHYKDLITLKTAHGKCVIAKVIWAHSSKSRQKKNA